MTPIFRLSNGLIYMDTVCLKREDAEGFWAFYYREADAAIAARDWVGVQGCVELLGELAEVLAKTAPSVAHA